MKDTNTGLLDSLNAVWGQAQWIAPGVPMEDVCPEYYTDFRLKKPVRGAMLHVTATGNYRATLNGQPVGDAVLTPGWTVYRERLQYQSYDVTHLLEQDNLLKVSVGAGWYKSRLALWDETPQYEEDRIANTPSGMIALLNVLYTDGTTEQVFSGDSWQVRESMIRYSDIYHGETADASLRLKELGTASVTPGPESRVIPQQGEWIKEQERLSPKAIFTTAKGEVVVDFGQNLTGYVQISLQAKAGDLVELSHAEILDKDGNFYTENYRSAKAKYRYICADGFQTWNPQFTFFGFRYIRLDSFPGVPAPENFTAVVVHSDMKRTGYVRSANPLLNQFFDNVLWGQKGNFVDVPTDCPQRDERLGWTGDAQAFIKAACYQYDVEKFFNKWLEDMALDQRPNGAIPHIIPAVPWLGTGSAAWADAATICPWQIYQFYGNTEILRKQFDCMKRHLEYIASATTEPFLWIGDTHFGDWLGIDAPSGSYKGASNEDLIASAFYAHSTDLVIRAGHVLGEDVSEYEVLYPKIVEAWRARFAELKTQTEMVLAVHFRLANDLQSTADRLADAVQAAGVQLMTGFVGTPYLLHVLSDYGYTDLAYQLLLRTEYPSWLYPVTQGATTVWEHWDGKKPDGSFWSADMNSFNHYAYGAVLDWVYEKAAGIQVMEHAPGFTKVRIAPQPNPRLEWLDAQLETRNGHIHVYWHYTESSVRYDISVAMPASVCIGVRERMLQPGQYVFYE